MGKIMSVEQAISLIKNGDTVAFGFAEAFAQQEMQTWYNEPHRWLYARVLQRIGNGSDAADVAQDTVLSVITIEDR